MNIKEFSSLIDKTESEVMEALHYVWFKLGKEYRNLMLKSDLAETNAICDYLQVTNAFNLVLDECFIIDG